MKIIYFDTCAIPLFLMILFVCHSRRMIRGNANQLFITLVLLSLFSALADLGMEIADNAAPLSEAVDMLPDMNCDYIQGYYYSRPLPADEFVRFLKEHGSTDA